MKTNKNCALRPGAGVGPLAARATDSGHPSLVTRHSRRGFTLIELLVVIAIIAILASMSLAVLASAKKAAQKKKALLEAQGIVTAILAYDSAHGRFPVSNEVQKLAGTGDFTFGGGLFQAQFPTTNPDFFTNNAGVIAILMDVTTNEITHEAVNFNHRKNPQQTIYLNASVSDYDPNALPPNPQPPGGVDKTGVYRDPWGNPYIISMDLNYDEHCNDAFYSLDSVSKQSGNSGYNGLVNPDGAANNFRYHGRVMVWSAGPDRKIDPNFSARAGVNKDNVLSWQ